VREHKDQSLTAAKTDSFDIPESGIIDAIIPIVATKNSNANHQAVDPFQFHHLSAIELIANGKTPLFSLTGDQLLARYFHDHGRLPAGKLDMYGSAYQYQKYPMYFGAHEKDPDYGLNAAKFSDLKLKITNKATSTNFDTTDLKVDVDIVYHEDRAGPPAKYMLPYEYESYTPETDTATKRIELPDRQLMRKVWTTLDRDRADATSKYTCHPYELAAKLKLLLRNRVLTVFDETYARHSYFNIQDVERPGWAHVRGAFYSADYYLDQLFAYPLTTSLTVQTQDTSTTDLVVFSHLSERLAKPRGLTGSGVQVSAAIYGWGILDSFLVADYTKLGEPNYLDPAKVKPAQLEFESSKDDGEIQVCVEEVWPN
jgi:hypothetical protein